MPSVNWDLPSVGDVNDSDPALALKNVTGAALAAKSEATAVTADSVNGLALVARSDQSVAGLFSSPQSVGVYSVAPEHSASINLNRTAASATVLSACLAPAGQPNAMGGVGVLGLSDRLSAVGAAGVALGSRSVGVHGEAPEGVGVRGFGESEGVFAVSEKAHGVRGTTLAAAAAGVYGYGNNQSDGVRAYAQAGSGVAAHSEAGTGVKASSSQAHGVTGEASAPNAVGVMGINDSDKGTGVYGLSNKGVAMHAQTWGGTALKAKAFTGQAIEVECSGLDYAMTSVSNGGGLKVQCITEPALYAQRLVSLVTIGKTSDTGIDAFSLGTTVKALTLTGHAIHGVGIKEAGAWAGYFEGDVYVTGTIYKSAVCFSIDHPLDPEGKVLNHAAVESNEYKNFYDGEVVLDEQGQAQVELPGWFAALNTGFRYQLTPIGAPAPELHIAESVRENRFRIAGGAPKLRVSWQVTGVRRDAWATDNPLEVEAPSERRPRPTAPGPVELARLRREAEASAETLQAEAMARRDAAEDAQPPGAAGPAPKPEPGSLDGSLKDAAEKALRTASRMARDLDA